MYKNNDSSNVTVGKPKKGGAIFYAPLGTTLPTNALDDLADEFVNVGYISEDGLTNSNSPESSDLKAWGGDTVLSMQTAKPDSFKFKIIEAKSADALAYIYGADNVSGDLETGITVVASTADMDYMSLVIDMELRGGILKRIVIPTCKITAVEDIVYKDSDAVGYGTTITATPDLSGNTHYEYILNATPSA